MHPLGKENQPAAWPAFSDVLAAYKKCRLKKSPSTEQIVFEAKLGEELRSLWFDIRQHRYRPSPSACFIVTYPRVREVFAAPFRDRVVHHLIVSQLEPHWERKFSQATFACRKGMGTHGAVRFFQAECRRLSQSGRRPLYALQLDIASFFVTISRSILTQLLLDELPRTSSERWQIVRELVQATFNHDPRKEARLKSTPQLRALVPAEKSWFAQAEGSGLPIGNLTSQFGANVYLNGVDHFVQRTLKPQSYFRYMDDLTLLDTDPERLKQMIAPIDEWLRQERQQKLNPSKTKLNPLSQGILYLGYRVRQVPGVDSGIRLEMTVKKKWDLIQALRVPERNGFPELRRLHPLAIAPSAKERTRTLCRINSRLGLFRHAHSLRFRQKSLRRFIQMLENPKGIPAEFFDAYTPVKIRRDLRAVVLK